MATMLRLCFVVASFGLVVGDSVPSCQIADKDIDVAGLSRSSQDTFFTVPSLIDFNMEWAFNICGDLGAWTTEHKSDFGIVKQPAGRSKYIETSNKVTTYGYWGHGGTSRKATFTATNDGAKFELYGFNNSFNSILELKCVHSCENKFADYWDSSRVCSIEIDQESKNLHNGTVKMAITTEHACEHMGGGGGNDEPEMLAAVASVLIACGVVLILYFVIGSIYQYRNGYRGVEVIPNNDIWFNLPGLIKDGCSYSRHACTSLKFRKSSSTWGPDNYENLLPATDLVHAEDDEDNEDTFFPRAKA